MAFQYTPYNLPYHFLFRLSLHPLAVMAFHFQFYFAIPFSAVPQGTTSSIRILVLQANLWLWQVAVIQAKIIILLEDWRFTPTIAPALDQSGVFPVEV